MRHWVDRNVERLGGLLLPPRCVLCGSRGQAPHLDLCIGCQASFGAALDPVLVDHGLLRRCYAPFAYAAPLDHLVHSLKYRGHLATGRVLGTLLADRIAALGLHRDVDVIVPVPLHPARHAERGFNQSAEIARHLGRRLQLPIDERLAARRRATPPQVGLHLGERRRNLAGAFLAAAATGRRVAIVDDVTTTGTTLQELARDFLRTGAGAVDAWCVARADRRGIQPQTGREPSPAAGRMR
jgi:ComF family protein